MAKTVAPFPPPPRPGKDACGELVTFYWAGEYKAHCISPKSPRHKHDDGITWSKMCSVCGHTDQHAYHPDGTGWPVTILECTSCPDRKCVLLSALDAEDTDKQREEGEQ
jgi:hypothetical protein